jgi:hypothetical protein
MERVFREVMRFIAWGFGVCAVVNTVLIIRVGERVLAHGYGDISIERECLKILLTGGMWYLWDRGVR